MKRKLLVLGIIILVIANISALVTIAYNRWFKSEEAFRSASPRHSFAFLCGELSLTEDQMAQLQALRASFDNQIGEVRITLREKRAALMEELRRAAPDSTRINQLIDEIGTLQSELQKQAIRYMLQEKATLTPEQREKFFSMFEEHFHRRGMMPRPGRIRPRGPQGRSFESEKKRKSK
jgi:Spy/CpxP family protein refolding chaperone